MPKLTRKTPCNDCPFRLNARAGWLGTDTVAGFLTKTLDDEPMPCHVAIDYDGDPDWEANQLPDAPYCAGGLIFLRNYMKMPRDPELAAAVRGVDKSAKVFGRPEEFSAHHGGEALSETTARSRFYEELEAKEEDHDAGADAS